MSVGSVIAFGKFRMVHLGDLTQQIEVKLMCPNNQIGVADLWVVSHHGQPYSNRPDAGARDPATGRNPEQRHTEGRTTGSDEGDFFVARSRGSLAAAFFAVERSGVHAPGMFIANAVDEPQPAMPVAPMPAPAPGPGTPPAPVHNGKAYWLKVSAETDGSFTVTNTRNGFSKTYKAR